MGLRINTNVAALNAYNNLSTNQGNLEGAFAKLSSGHRINKAADDAAGLSIAQGLTSQINGLTQAVSNANDGINVAQIADGALGTTQDILQRMRTLVVKAGNVGTQDADSLGAIQKEMRNLGTQLNNIASQTKFGQTNLLGGGDVTMTWKTDGSVNAFAVTDADKGGYKKNFQVGANGGDTIELDLSKGVTYATHIGGTVASDTSVTGGFDLTNLAITNFDETGTGTSGTGGIGQYSYYKLDSGGASTDSTTEIKVDANVYGTTEATNDLATIDAAIDAISASRSQIGAVQNQLNYTVDNLQTGITNVTASRSNLMDADLATQVTKMSQSQILMQASTSVLAQANSAPQAILKLLQ